MFSKIGAAVLFVQDLDKCVAFYRDTLGLQIAMTDEVSAAFKMADHDFAILKVSEAVEMTSEAAVLPQSGSRVMLCADVEDVDAAYKTLTEKGVTFIRPPMDKPWGYRTAYFADPEGNVWEFRHTIKVEQAK
jgi:lactoylglutathione lyase